jgi:hypothetical protein
LALAAQSVHVGQQLSNSLEIDPQPCRNLNVSWGPPKLCRKRSGDRFDFFLALPEAARGPVCIA